MNATKRQVERNKGFRSPYTAQQKAFAATGAFFPTLGPDKLCQKIAVPTQFRDGDSSGFPFSLQMTALDREGQFTHRAYASLDNLKALAADCSLLFLALAKQAMANGISVERGPVDPNGDFFPTQIYFPTPIGLNLPASLLPLALEFAENSQLDEKTGEALTANLFAHLRPAVVMD